MANLLCVTKIEDLRQYSLNTLCSNDHASNTKYVICTTDSITKNNKLIEELAENPYG